MLRDGFQEPGIRDQVRWGKLIHRQRRQIEIERLMAQIQELAVRQQNIVLEALNPVSNGV